MALNNIVFTGPDQAYIAELERQLAEIRAALSRLEARR